MVRSFCKELNKMPSFFEKPLFFYPLYALIGVIAAMVGFLFFYNWVIGCISAIVAGCLLFFFFYAVKRLKLELEHSISDLTFRLKKAGDEVFMKMPIGIMLINDQFAVEWVNPFLASYFKNDKLVGRPLDEISETLKVLFQKGIDSDIVTLQNRKFRVIVKKEERLLYFFDETDHTELKKQYESERIVLAYIFLDNYDEIAQGLDDQKRSNLNSLVTSILNKWAVDNGIFLKRVSSERFIAVFNEKILAELEKTKFSILDEVREKAVIQNVSLTLSIGIGAGIKDLSELGHLAQSSLDLALGRGGDQVAIKRGNGKVKFYGGQTNPIEKRTRVRARVISHALKEIIRESDKVFIMGHKNPDMDSIGSAIGILKVAQINHKEGFIVVNHEEFGQGLQKLVEEVKKDAELWSRFITPDEALNIATDHSLLVILDTNKPSMVAEQKLLSEIDHVVVIDHHRRGEEFIQDPLLVYIEPYASSTSELVTEILVYQPAEFKMSTIEATALLAGITVDTKCFTLRTGSRTFDAASYLRSKGADTILVQKLLKEDIQQFVQRAKFIQNTEIMNNGVAIAKADQEDEYYDQVIIAQAADTLLSMNGVLASFVIAKRDEHTVGISARSLGDFNVQLIMEALGGGGHLTNAATQLEHVTINEAEKRLKEAVQQYLEGRNEE